MLWVCGDGSALWNSIKFVFSSPKLHVTVFLLLKTEFIAEDCHRLASAHLPQGQKDTKTILMVPCLSPASHPVSAAGEALAEEENQQVWPRKNHLFLLPKGWIQAGHNSVLGEICNFVCLQEKWRHKEIQAQFYSYNSLPGKNHPWDTQKTPGTAEFRWLGDPVCSQKRSGSTSLLFTQRLSTSAEYSRKKMNTLKREQSIFKCPNHSKQEQPQPKQIWALCLTIPHLLEE